MSMTLSIDWVLGNTLKGALALDRPPTWGERSQAVRRVRRPSQTLWIFLMKLPARHQERNVREVPSFPGLARAPKVATEAARGESGTPGLQVSIPITPPTPAVLERDRFPFGAWVPHLDGLHCHPLPAGPATTCKVRRATSGSKLSCS